MNQEAHHLRAQSTSLSASTDYEPFSPLPVELVRWILEIAASEDASTSLALACLSKAVQKWITPIIYHTIVLTSEDDIEHLYHTLRESEISPGASVRRLCINRDIGDSATIVEIICGCPQIDCLFTNVVLMDPEYLNEFRATSSAPWHMMVTNQSTDFPIPPSSHPLLKKITHLYLDLLPEKKTIQSIPNLTYLGLSCWGDSEVENFGPQITDLLSSLPLVLLLLHAFIATEEPMDVLFGALWHELAQIEDERLFAGPGLYEDDYIELLCSGGTIWDDAQVRYKDWRRLVRTSEN